MDEVAAGSQLAVYFDRDVLVHFLFAFPFGRHKWLIRIITHTHTRDERKKKKKIGFWWMMPRESLCNPSLMKIMYSTLSAEGCEMEERLLLIDVDPSPCG